MRTSALFGAKIFGFFEIYGVSAVRTNKGIGPVRIFCEQCGSGSIFRDFVRTSFMDGPLLTQEILQYKSQTLGWTIYGPFVSLGYATISIWITKINKIQSETSNQSD